MYVGILLCDKICRPTPPPSWSITESFLEPPCHQCTIQRNVSSRVLLLLLVVVEAYQQQQQQRKKERSCVCTRDTDISVCVGTQRSSLLLSNEDPRCQRQAQRVNLRQMFDDRLEINQTPCGVSGYSNQNLSLWTPTVFHKHTYLPRRYIFSLVVRWANLVSGFEVSILSYGII